jgi:sarcosine oxidase gamma subunit
MNSAFIKTDEVFRMDVIPSAQDVEVIALPSQPAFDCSSKWPTHPGAAQLGCDGRTSILHYAADRWLVSGPGVSATLLAAAAPQAYATIDVTGKWQAFRLCGERSGRLLASTIDIETALAGRDCAGVTLFDCPAIVARTDGMYLVWVQRSYGTDFQAALHNQLLVLRERPP